MRFSILILCLLLGYTGISQNVDDLLNKLEAAESRKEKTILNYKLAEAYKVKGVRELDNARKYADDAFTLASGSPRDYQMLAQVAMLKGELHNMDRSNSRAYVSADAEFKKAIQYAQTAKDLGLIAEATKERANIAIRKKKSDRQARMIYEDAFQYFSSISISKLGTDYEEAKVQLDRAKRQLEADKQKLEKDLISLNQQVQDIKNQKDRLQASNSQLQKSNKQAKQQLNEQTKELQNISQEKVKVEEVAEQRQKELEKQNEKINLMSGEQARQALKISEQDKQNMKLQMETDRIRNFNFMIGGIAAGFFIIVLLVWGRLNSSRKAKKALEGKNRQIEFERERSDELLKNILPASIAEELKEKGKASAKDYKEVTVLFSDFKNFTKIAEKLTPNELVMELDKCFKAFDFIISQYQDIEKIKTIGDAYMCASGLTDRKTLPNNLVKAALEMQEYLNEYKQERIRIGKPFFEARIGIHTGPVVAGVVGLKKFAYDIWGDTVNIASRMESESKEGRVNVSDETYKRIKYHFECEYRGKVPAKNKGNIDMYFVNRARKTVPA